MVKGYTSLILDTGPLLHILVGLYNPKKLDKVGSSETNFALILTYTRQFKEILITPHILAEMSNLAKVRLKSDFSTFMKSTVKFLHKAKEKNIKKDDIISPINLKILLDFGVADTATFLSSNKKSLILTSDTPLLVFYGSNTPMLCID